MWHIKTALAITGFLFVLGASARADSLQLKNGNMVEGKYLGGTEHSVQFEVNGKVHVFDIDGILSISFAAASADGGMPTDNAEPPSSSQKETKANPSSPDAAVLPVAGPARPHAGYVGVRDVAWKHVQKSAYNRSATMPRAVSGSGCSIGVATSDSKTRVFTHGKRPEPNVEQESSLLLLRD